MKHLLTHSITWLNSQLNWLLAGRFYTPTNWGLKCVTLAVNVLYFFMSVLSSRPENQAKQKRLVV